jgi:type II secretory pathway pseudopilin PulG
MHPERCPTPQVVSDTVQQPAFAADTRRVVIRLRDESGMGLIELLIAMVVLNVGLFAVVSVFSSATTAMGRAATISSATAVADKQMEIYRSLKNCAIWLDANTSPVNTTTFPAINSGSAYQADVKSYTDLYASPIAPVAFFDKSLSDPAMGTLPWATNKTTQVLVVPWNSTIPTFCNPSGLPPASLTASTTPPLTATKAVQTIAGPDGVQYPVYTYIILTQPSSGAAYSGSWVKQVTIVVRDPRNTARILARQTSLFDWADGP